MAIRRFLCLTGALLLAGSVLRAETIYSNFGTVGPNGAGGGWILGHGMLGLSGPFAIAVPFVPPADYTLDTIRLPLRSLTPDSQDQFTVEIRDGATQPGAVLDRYSRSLTGFALMELDSSTHPVLYSGRQYWVVVSTTGWGEWGLGGRTAFWNDALPSHPRQRVAASGQFPWSAGSLRSRNADHSPRAVHQF